MTRLLKKFLFILVTAAVLSGSLAIGAYSAPPTFTNFVTKTEDGASLKIHWTSSGSGITYTVKYYPEGSTPAAALTKSAADVYEMNINGLTANTVYYFQVLANGTPLNDYVPAATYAMEIPSADFNAENNTFSWTDSEHYPASEYKLVYSKNADMSASSEANTASKQQQVNALTANTVYYYKIGAKNSDGIYNYRKDNYDEHIVYSAKTLPAKISNFNIESLTSETANASWTISGTPAYRGNYYVLEASESSSFTQIDAKTSNLDVTASSAMLTGLRPNKHYYFRLRSVNEAGSATATVKAGGRSDAWTLASQIGTDPNVLHITSDYGSITVNFETLPDSDCTGYILQVSTNPAFPAESTTEKAGGIGTTSLTAQESAFGDYLLYATTYTVRMITLNGNNDRTITNLGQKKTETVGPPQNLSISQIFQTSATIQFDKITPAPKKYIIKVFDSGHNPIINTEMSPQIGDIQEFHTSSTGINLIPNRPYTATVAADYGSEERESDAEVRYTMPQTLENFYVLSSSPSNITVRYKGISEGEASNFKLTIASDEEFNNVVYEDYGEPISLGDIDFTTMEGLLIPNTLYHLRGSLVNEEDRGLHLTVSTMTLATQPVIKAPLAATANTITATLAPNGNPVGTRFKIVCSKNSDFSTEDSHYTHPLQQGETEEFTVSCNNLDTSTEYYAKIVPINDSNATSSALFLGTASTSSPKPDVPANNSGYEVNTGSITVKWTGKYTDELGSHTYPDGTRYHITIWEDENYSTHTLVNNSSITIHHEATFTGLKSNRKYYFKAAACNSNNPSTICDINSQSEEAIMPPAISSPSVPAISSTVFTEVGLNNFTVNWEHGNNDESSVYEIYTSSVCDSATLIMEVTQKCGTNYQNGCPGIAALNAICKVSVGIADGANFYTFGDMARGEIYSSVLRTRGKSAYNVMTGFLNAGTVKTVTTTGVNTIYRDSETKLEILTSYGNIALNIPLYAFSTTMKIQMEPMFAVDFQSSSFTYTTTVGGINLIPSHVGVKIEPVLGINGYIHYTVDNPLTLTLSYNDDDFADDIVNKPFALAGSAPLSDKLRSKLILAYHDELTDTWNPVESESDIANHKITARIWKLGAYQIMRTSSQKSPSNVKIYPNPYKPNTNGGYVHFVNLPDLGNGSKIKIFTFLGELVQEIDVSGTSATWDGLNKHGNDTASGIYIVYVQSNDNKSLNKVYKLAIER